LRPAPSRWSCRKDCFVVADASPDAGPAPLRVHFAARADCPRPLVFQWSFGDGTPRGAGANLVHVFRKAGDYPARVDVQAADGSSGYEQIDISVISPLDG